MSAPDRVLRVIKTGFLLLLGALSAMSVQAESPAVNGQVLIIHSYHSGLSWTDSIMNGIRDTFSRSGADIEMSAEYLDARRYPDSERASRIRELVISKLEGKTPKLVMVSDNAALDFVLAQRDRLFPDTPIVFCGVNDFHPSMISGYRAITGVAEETPVTETVELALRFHPGTRQIIVVGRTSVAADKYNHYSFVAALPRLLPQVKVTFWDDLPLSELRARLDELKDGSVLFLNGLITDETGRQLMYGETTRWICRNSAVPAYSLWDVYLGYGIVGGKLVSGYRQGQMAAELALRILKGESADRLPVISGLDANQYMFDYEQLMKFQVPLSELPQDAILVNRPDTFYQKYKTLVWATTAIVLVLSGLVMLLGLTIIRQRRTKEALRQANLVVENSPVVLFRRRVTEDWPVELVSRNVTQFGYAAEELLSGAVPFSSMVHPEDLARVALEIREYAASGVDQFQQEYRIVTKEGDIRWVDDRTVIGRDAGGRISHFQGIVIDITERKQAEDALKRAHDSLEAKVRERTAELAIAKERAEAANKAKSVFLTNMSHELRTPLNAILGYSQMMQRDPSLLPQQREYLNTINRSGEHLMALINDVLEISRIEARRIMLELQTCDLSALLRDLEAMFRVRTDARGLQFNLTGIGGLPRYVITDENKLRQVLINLLGNAVKFTKKGGIVVQVGMREGAGDEMRLVVEVKDTGAGIAEGEQERVFQYFEQAASGRQGNSGTGLGLAISREYARMMGGDITVASQLGLSSTFRLEIDVKRGTESDLREKPGKRRVIGLEPGQFTPRILVAEDTEESRTLMVRLLEEVGFEVREAADGREAVAVFEEFQPHFIWVDIRMPVMDGLEATRRIKATPAGKSTIVAALTAHALEEEREPILAAGCDDLVRKPYREQEIFEVMAHHLGVKYVYEPDQAAELSAKPKTDLSPEELTVLPIDLRKELHEAVLRLNTARTFETIAKIAERDASLGAALRALAESMDYHRLLVLVEETTIDARRGNA